jgi:hypothetical protein
MTSLHDLTNEALRRWVAATGVDPDSDSSRVGNWTVQRTNDWIKIAQKVDPTGLTTYLYLRSVARDYVCEHKIDALRLIECGAEVEQEIAPLRALLEALAHPDLVQWATAFQQQLRDTAEDQGVLDQTATVIDDLSALGHIRLDALYATGTLCRDTFARGPRRAGHLRYNRRVLKFWNVNSLVRAMETQPEDGISMCLLRDPNVVEHSFFAFAVRDGDVREIWSDVPQASHPMHKHMSRSRALARSLEDRAGALRFPYQLLDAKFVDEGRRVVPDNSSEALVRTNIEAVAIASLADLPADQILWAIMMFDLLRHQPENVGDLSCTGETVYLALTGTAQKALGTLEPLTRTDVTAEALAEQLTRSDFSFRSTGANDWMDRRYSDAVDESVYNLFETQTQGALRSPTTGVIVSPTKDPFKQRTRDLAAIDPMSFGPSKRMQDDRLWTARYNQALRVQALAQEEYERRKEEVWEWFVDCVTRNSSWFVGAACRGTAPFLCPQKKAGAAIESPLEVTPFEMIRWQRRSKGSTPSMLWDGCSGPVALYTPWERYAYRRRVGKTIRNWENSPPKCFISGEVASVWTLFEPRTPDMLRALVGGEKLPDVLEHWVRDKPYNGNSILDRTDPMDSMIENPWLKTTFHVMLGLSLREFRRQCKAHGVTHPEDFAEYRRSGDYGGWDFWRFGRSETSEPREEESEQDDATED